jgi:hypothetical protein
MDVKKKGRGRQDKVWPMDALVGLKEPVKPDQVE